MDEGGRPGDRCAYCDAELLEATSRFNVEINAWNAEQRHGAEFPDFCSREHLTAYFAEDRLPTTMFDPHEGRNGFGCVASAVAVMILVPLLALIGFITVLRWLV